MNITNFFKNILLVLIIVIGSHFLAGTSGLALAQFLNIGGSIGGNILEYYMFGFPVTYFFLTFLSFSLFGDKNKYWWIGIILVPALLFEVRLAPVLIIFSFIFALIAWLLGTIANKALLKLAPAFMAKIS